MKRIHFFDIFLFALMIFICLIMVYPFWNLFMNSITAPDVNMSVLRLFPERVSLSSYVKAIESGDIGRGYLNTIVRTVLGIGLNLILTVTLAYPLSKKHLPNKAFITGFVVFTMYFNGGVVPNYLLIRSLGLYDTVWALVLPHAVNVFHLIIVRNFFISIPYSLEESAMIDGCNEFQILTRIVLPLSKSIMATLLLWAAVFHWNAWFDAMIYIKSSEKQVLQTIMRRVVLGSMSGSANGAFEELVNPENIKAATIMLTVGPIIVVYPFIQRYFIKGQLAGAIKG
ncbi:MAG: carbohydrate ABC transporter permease [Firmicutes bacterium]|nr:carbohydrate ABC transporter permease [Bacillota bacterium]